MKKLVILIVISLIAVNLSATAQRSNPNFTNKIQAGTSKVFDIIYWYSTTTQNQQVIYDYDVNGNNSLISYKYNLSGVWKDNYKEIQGYDSKNQLISYLRQSFSTGSWVDNSKAIYEYDNQGNLLLSYWENYANKVWLPYMRYEMTYNENGDRLSYMYKRWQNGQLSFHILNTFSYDSKGNFVLQVNQALVNGVLTNTKRYTNIYDEKNNNIESITESWNTITNSWDFNSKAFIEYDEQGNETLNLVKKGSLENLIDNQRTRTTWDSKGKILTWFDESFVDGKWILNQKEEYSYDDKGNQLTYYYEYWESGALNFCEKDFYTYDGKGNLLEWKWQEQMGEEWQDRDRKKYEYDNEGYITLVKSENFVAGQWIDKNSSITVKDSKDETSFTGFKLEVTYKTITKVKEQEEIALTISPNPATDFIEVYSPSIKRGLGGVSDISIYNMLGECVLSVETQNFVSLQRIDISTLPTGLYLVKIGEITKKFVKR